MKRDMAAGNHPFRADDVFVGKHLSELLKLTTELRTAYATYPKLGEVVAAETWEQLTDVPYRQLLRLNLARTDRAQRDAIGRNLLALEDLLASTLVRSDTGLRDTLTRVLRYRLANGLLAK